MAYDWYHQCTRVFFFFKQKTAYEITVRLEFRRVLFRSSRPRLQAGVSARASSARIAVVGTTGAERMTHNPALFKGRRLFFESLNDGGCLPLRRHDRDAFAAPFGAVAVSANRNAVADATLFVQGRAPWSI